MEDVEKPKRKIEEALKRISWVENQQKFLEKVFALIQEREKIYGRGELTSRIQHTLDELSKDLLFDKQQEESEIEYWTRKEQLIEF